MCVRVCACVCAAQLSSSFLWNHEATRDAKLKVVFASSLLDVNLQSSGGPVAVDVSIIPDGCSNSLFSHVSGVNVGFAAEVPPEETADFTTDFITRERVRLFTTPA